MDGILNILDKILNPLHAYEIKSENMTNENSKKIVKYAFGADVPTDFEVNNQIPTTYSYLC